MSEPQWSDDGKSIAYISLEGASSASEYHYNLWVTNPEGIERKQLTVDIEVIGHPRWSKDSMWILFEGTKAYENPESKDDLWLINRDDTQLKRITSDSVNENWPEWTNDGYSVIYSADGEFLKQIFLFNRSVSDISTSTGEFIVLP